MRSASDPGSGELTARGTTTCRGCGKRNLKSVLDLGEQPLANELPASDDASDERFPLHLRICRSCGLGQVGEFVLPERIFGDYPYLSSMSTSWQAHARAFAVEQVGRLRLNNHSWVLEVASNDGYLLREFKSLGVGVLGVEPAENVAIRAREAGIETVTAFFGRSTAEKIRDRLGSPDLIVANNVMAHVPDLSDFLAGFATICSSQTLISVENPSFLTLLSEGQFDTVYHEHFSYLSVHAVDTVARLQGLELIDIEMLSTHGGSYRYWLGLQGAHRVSPRVNEAIAEELDSGLMSDALHRQFASNVQRTVGDLRDWLLDRASRGRKVIAYGAAAKGNTLLNAAGVDRTLIQEVVDASPEKQGRFLPGSHIPVSDPSDLASLGPDDVLLLPWNIQREVADFLGVNCPNSELWIAIPGMARVPT